MPTPNPAKGSAYLLMAAGCAFLVAAYAGGQWAFLAPAVVFVVLGARRLYTTRGN